MTAAGVLAEARLDAALARYTVAVATNQQDAYTAAQRAIGSLPAGEFPDVSGRPVVIKANLVVNRTAGTGTTTDPALVRAIADLCLANGATHITVVESGQIARSGELSVPPWSDCGYVSTFSGYSTVSLVNMDATSRTLTPVPDGFVYSEIYVPDVLTAGDPVLISAAKLKTHIWAGASLSTKNLFGFYPSAVYYVPNFISRGDPHLLSLAQATADINLIRPPDFSVIDGIWGMEGNGPWMGDPVNSGVVLAGRNSVAVDRVAVQVMGLQFPISHLDCAAHKGLGPSARQTSRIRTVGDTWQSLNFAPPQLSLPWVTWPVPTSPGISLSQRQTVTIRTLMAQRCNARFEMIQHQETSPTSVTVVKTLADWADYDPGSVESQVWDGTNDSGAPVEPGLRYLARITARRNSSATNQNHYNYGSCPIQVSS